MARSMQIAATNFFSTEKAEKNKAARTEGGSMEEKEGTKVKEETTNEILCRKKHRPPNVRCKNENHTHGILPSRNFQKRKNKGHSSENESRSNTSFGIPSQ